jgi:hypothetical protein
MAIVFNYAVLMAIPDPRRGERVNVGIVVFAPGGLDVRLTEMGKVKALTGNDWSSYATSAARRLRERYTSSDEAHAAITAAEPFDPILRATSPAWFALDSLNDYEGRIREILSALVVRPKRTAEKAKTTRINTEIARELKQSDVLAAHDEPMDSHKVVRDYCVEDELRADFAQRNGVLRVAATLDLRRAHVDIREATLKAIVLDRAKKVYGHDARRIGVYAALPEEMPHFKQHLELLHDYSDEVFNWQIEGERAGFMQFVKSGFPRI